MDASAALRSSSAFSDSAQNHEPGITHASSANDDVSSSSLAAASSEDEKETSGGKAANPYARKVSAGVLATPYVSKTSSCASYARDALSSATCARASNRSDAAALARGEWFKASAQGTNAKAPTLWRFARPKSSSSSIVSSNT